VYESPYGFHKILVVPPIDFRGSLQYCSFFVKDLLADFHRYQLVSHSFSTNPHPPGVKKNEESSGKTPEEEKFDRNVGCFFILQFLISA
jgi:hypothetical protein